MNEASRAAEATCHLLASLAKDLACSGSSSDEERGWDGLVEEAGFRSSFCSMPRHPTYSVSNSLARVSSSLFCFVRLFALACARSWEE